MSVQSSRNPSGTLYICLALYFSSVISMFFPFSEKCSVTMERENETKSLHSKNKSLVPATFSDVSRRFFQPSSDGKYDSLLFCKRYRARIQFAVLNNRRNCNFNPATATPGLSVPEWKCYSVSAERRSCGRCRRALYFFFRIATINTNDSWMFDSDWQHSWVTKFVDTRCNACVSKPSNVYTECFERVSNNNNLVLVFESGQCLGTFGSECANRYSGRERVGNFNYLRARI